MNSSVNLIYQFYSTHPRNKLVITHDPLLFNWIDMGASLSQRLEGRPIDSKVHFKINKWVRDIIGEAEDELYDFIAIKNIGILFEPEFKFNIKKFLQESSQNQNMVLLWEGAIADQTLYFLSPKDKYKIDLKDVSHIVI